MHHRSMRRRLAGWCVAWLATLVAGCAVVAEPPPPLPVLPALAEAPAVYQPPVVQDYRMQIGDALAIRSYFDAQLNQEALVRPDGRISAILLGDIVAAGLPPHALAQQMRSRYSRLVGATDLTVVVVRSANMNVYLNGELRSPSLLPLDGSLTLLQAVSRAGGMLASANTRSVLLIRNRDDGTLDVNAVDVDKILRNEAPDPYLRARDVVYVPKSQIAQVGQFVEQYINAIVPRAIQMQIGWVQSRVRNTNPVVQVLPP
jgi:protein involved in polysaccharide export with SLBB domain